jgi:hypothetical protein
MTLGQKTRICRVVSPYDDVLASASGSTGSDLHADEGRAAMHVPGEKYMMCSKTSS